MMWLNVAEYNPNAVAFYQSYGFKKTSVSRYRGGRQAGAQGQDSEAGEGSRGGSGINHRTDLSCLPRLGPSKGS